MWLLVLLVVKCTNFFLEAGILHAYSLVTCLLLVGCSFMLCCSCSMQLLMRYPVTEDTDLRKILAFCLKDDISFSICEVYAKCS